MTEKPWNAPLHPAEFFIEDFLKPLGMAEAEAASALGLSAEDLEPFLRERAPVTGELAIRLNSAFGCSPDYWLRLQNQYDLDVAKRRGVPDLPRVPGPIAAE